MDQKEEVIIRPFHLGEFLGDSHSLFGVQVYHWILWIIAFLFLSFIYIKIFRVRKLPLLKAIIVYALIAVGAFVLLVFEVDADLPVIYSLAVVVAMMVLLRIRLWVTGIRGKGKGDGSGA